MTITRTKLFLESFTSSATAVLVIGMLSLLGKFLNAVLMLLSVASTLIEWVLRAAKRCRFTKGKSESLKPMTPRSTPKLVYLFHVHLGV